MAAPGGAVMAKLILDNKLWAIIEPLLPRPKSVADDIRAQAARQSPEVSTFRLPLRNFQPFLAPDPLDPFLIHPPTLPMQWRRVMGR
jgi:hypothetical protein